MPPTPRPTRDERRQARQARREGRAGREPVLYRVSVLDQDGTERVNNFAAVSGSVVTLQHDYAGVEPAPGWRVLVPRLGLDLRVTSVTGLRLECVLADQSESAAQTPVPEQPRRRRKEQP